MSPAHDLPDVIALFALPGAVLLPRTRLPLQIFEPRYLALLDDVLKTPERLIGMIQPTGPEGELARIGCAGRVTGFNETDDGRYMITLTGRSRFAVTSEVEGFTPYRKAEVSWKGFDRDLAGPEEAPALRRPDFFDMLRRYFDEADLSTDWEMLEEAGDEMLVNSLSMLLPFETEDKQALLEAGDLQARLRVLETLLEFALYGGAGEEPMQ